MRPGSLASTCLALLEIDIGTGKVSQCGFRMDFVVIVGIWHYPALVFVCGQSSRHQYFS